MARRAHLDHFANGIMEAADDIRKCEGRCPGAEGHELCPPELLLDHPWLRLAELSLRCREREAEMDSISCVFGAPACAMVLTRSKPRARRRPPPASRRKASRSNTLPRGSSKPIGRPGRMLSPLRILKLDLLRTRYGRLFHRSAASVTVGAVGPNAEHFLHKTNFGSRSPLIQSSEEPQKGQGSSRQEDGTPVSAFCPGFSAIWFGPCLCAVSGNPASEATRATCPLEGTPAAALKGGQRSHSNNRSSRRQRSRQLHRLLNWLNAHAFQRAARLSTQAAHRMAENDSIASTGTCPGECSGAQDVAN